MQFSINNNYKHESSDAYKFSIRVYLTSKLQSQCIMEHPKIDPVHIYYLSELLYI